MNGVSVRAIFSFFLFFFWYLFVLSMGAVDEKCEMGAKKHATDPHASLLRKWADRLISFVQDTHGGEEVFFFFFFCFFFWTIWVDDLWFE
uniref:Uncharacterized protein n=1 Tax=Candidozyma auris TaxID=498019 RepID=A0A0L0P1F0_CANAR